MELVVISELIHGEARCKGTSEWKLRKSHHRFADTHLSLPYENICVTYIYKSLCSHTRTDVGKTILRLVQCQFSSQNIVHFDMKIIYDNDRLGLAHFCHVTIISKLRSTVMISSINQI